MQPERRLKLNSKENWLINFSNLVVLPIFSTFPLLNFVFAFVTALATATIAIASPNSKDNNFQLVLTNQDLDPSIQAKIELQFQEVLSKLPDSMKNRINKPVYIQFSNIKSKMLPDPFDVCKKQEVEWAYVPTFSFQNTIVLNNALLALFDDRNIGRYAENFNCGHGDPIKKFQSLLIHELTHVYDLRSPLTPAEQEELRDCDFFKKDDPRDLRCQYLRQLPAFVSGRNTFQKISAINKNQQKFRASDQYELKNPAENLGVNMEYFHLDPDFACRKPAYYTFLSSHFQHLPFKRKSCENSNFVIGAQDTRKVVLDAKRIFQVHYLYAGPSDAPMSQWGHAMIRLIVCAPERKIVNADCLKDISHHIVVSFRANVTDIMISYWKGLSGDYHSQIFILPMWKVINEYTRDDSRILTSYPIHFTESQKTFFVNHVLELFWSYIGKYYFITNNCASETLDLIAAALPDNHPFHFDMPILTPPALLQRLNRNGLIGEMPQDQKVAVQQGYVFLSTLKKDLQAAFDRLSLRLNESPELKSQVAPIRTVEDFLKKTTAQQRKDLYEKLYKKTSERTSLAASFFSLEMQIDRLFNKDLQRNVTKYFEQGENSQNSDAIEKFRKMTQDFSHWNYVKGGYGVPTAQEFDQESMQKAFDLLNKDYGDITKIIQLFDPDLAKEKQEIQSNLSLFFTRQFEQKH